MDVERFSALAMSFIVIVSKEKLDLLQLNIQFEILLSSFSECTKLPTNSEIASHLLAQFMLLATFPITIAQKKTIHYLIFLIIQPKLVE